MFGVVPSVVPGLDSSNASTPLSLFYYAHIVNLPHIFAFGGAFVLIGLGALPEPIGWNRLGKSILCTLVNSKVWLFSGSCTIYRPMRNKISCTTTTKLVPFCQTLASYIMPPAATGISSRRGTSPRRPPTRRRSLRCREGGTETRRGPCRSSTWNKRVFESSEFDHHE